MDVTILNTNLDAVSIVDTYESFIWTDRYYAYGDFELYEAMREGLLDYIKQDYYLQSKESEHVMIVEKIQITSDTEDGNHVTVTGRSLESILDRRIVWGQKLYKARVLTAIRMEPIGEFYNPDYHLKPTLQYLPVYGQSKNSKLYFQRINRSSNYKVETGSSVHGR